MNGKPVVDDLAPDPAVLAAQRRAGARGLRWTARVLSLLLVGFWLFLFINDMTGNPASRDALSRSARDQRMLAFMAVYVVGVLLAWKWEVVGGALGAAGIGCFIGTLMLERGVSRLMPFCIVLSVPVACYLLGAWLRSLAERGEPLTKQVSAGGDSHPSGGQTPPGLP